MGSGDTQQDVTALRRRAEQALRQAKPRVYVIRVLEQLASAARSHADTSRWAHRQLAELRLEESPWHAALHLRRVLEIDPHDDAAHAMAGLCHALMANYRAAARHFHRATRLSPNNPYHLHNLGHLLDVSLDDTATAIPYLRHAHTLEPTQRELTLSLAHALARSGATSEARALLAALHYERGRDGEIRALERWIDEGAPRQRARSVPSLIAPFYAPAAPPTSQSDFSSTIVVHSTDGCGKSCNCHRLSESVERLLCERFSGRPYGSATSDAAIRLWRDYRRVAAPAAGRAAVFAAAIEYALSRVNRAPANQREIAESHGVSVSALQSRHAMMRACLGLEAGDPRYALRAATPTGPALQ